MNKLAAALLGLVAMGVAASPGARAEVTRFEVTSTTPAFAGAEFGSTGRYERLAARATIALDPNDARNAGIVDLSQAPRNAQGRVEATADVVVLRPVEALRGNGTLFVEVPNRGRELAGQLFNDINGANRLASGQDAGNGYLLRQGYTLVWVGWQTDLLPNEGLRLQAPVVPGITGLSREEYLFDHMRSPVTVRLTYPAAKRDDAVLTVRAQADDARARPADLRHRWVDDHHVEIFRPAGFDAGALYEFTYTAKDPVVQGMAFAAFRDVAAFLRREGGTANPLAAHGRTPIARAVLHGVSQSGRFVRDFLYGGFNQDEAGRQVFEAMQPHIAGTRRTFTNARFAQPGRNPTPHGDRHYPADQFPFTYATQEDALTGRRDGLLARCAATATCPRIIQTDSEYEFYGARASLLVTDTRGHHAELPENVRAFLMTGHPHFAAPTALGEMTERCALPVNPLHAGAPMRAVLSALEAWVVEGRLPPPSRYPTRAAGTLRPAAGLYPAIPQLPYRGTHGPAQLVDIIVVPPVVRGEYPVLLPRVDADGNAIGGVRAPALEVPKASYVGWNPRAPGFAPGALCYNTGAVVAFAATRAERETARDPRLSVEERYATPAAYVAAVKAAAERLVAERMLLAEDLPRIAAMAEADSLARLKR